MCIQFKGTKVKTKPKKSVKKVSEDEFKNGDPNFKDLRKSEIEEISFFEKLKNWFFKYNYS